MEALLDIPNVHVTVSAPLENQSGTGGNTTPGGVSATSLETRPTTTPAWAVDGFPADSVLYALNILHVNPDFARSLGSTTAQNIGPFVSLSGTVGAARVGGRLSIPAVAVLRASARRRTSRAVRTCSMTWVEEFLFGREGPGAVRVSREHQHSHVHVRFDPRHGTRARREAFNNRPFDPSDCLSTSMTFADDVDGFINGYVTQSSIGT